MGKRLLVVLIMLLGAAGAQVSSHTAFRIRFGAALPATCSPNTGDVFFKTAATIGAYQCLVANTWTAIGGVSSIAPLLIVDANTLAQANTTTAQTLQIYNTTDSNTVPVNYERASMGWVANVFTIQATKGGTGTLRGIDFGGTAYRFLLSAGGSTGFSINAATGTVSTYAGTGTIGQGLVAIRGTVLASTGLTGNLGATTVLTGFGSSAGLYKVCFQASTTTSGTGTTGTVTLAWNDGNAKSFTTGTWALNAVDVTGQVNSCQTIRMANSQNITVATTIGSIGTSVYRVDATVMQLQ